MSKKGFTQFKFGLAALLSAALLSACSSNNPPGAAGTQQTVWPAAPEQPRYRFIMSITSSDDILRESDSNPLRRLIVGKPKPRFAPGRPLDIAVRNGLIYLIDGESPLIHVFNLQTRTYFNFGYRLQGTLNRPVGIAVDSDGLVYVSDRGRNSVVVYDSMGLYLRHYSLAGVTSQIAGIAVTAGGDTIYVVDRGGIDSDSHQVVKLTRDGQVSTRIGKRGHGEGEFNLPQDIALDKSENIYVLDSGNFRVQIFNRRGRFLDSFGKVGDGLGQFGQPRSIAIDSDDLLYISDSKFGNVQVFLPEGRLLLPLGSLSGEALPGHYSLISGIAVDQHGYLYILDQYQKKIEIFRKLEDG